MAMTAVGSTAIESTAPSAGTTKLWSPLPLVAMVGIVVAFCGSWRWYQQIEGFKSGLDATEAAFWEKWMPLWYLNLAMAAVAQTPVPVTLGRTRDRAPPNLLPEVELKRYFLFFAMLVTMTMTQTISIVFGATDAAWHQVVVRDTSLTPSHIVLFFGIVPLFTTFGLAAFFYALTRIPDFSRSVPLALVLAIMAPFMVLPSVAYNEWGHAFWLMEELFIAPLHWGFVALAWGFMAALGVIGLSLPRVAELVRLTSGPAVVR